MSITITPFADSAEAAAKEHKKYVGANERPPGSNMTEFGASFGLNPAPYCAMAIERTAYWTGSTAAMPRSASSSAIQRGLTAVGRSVSTPQRNDNVHVYKNGRSVHIERVLSFKDGRLICIGSNTSSTSGGSTADGGGTYINDRTKWWRNRNSNSGWSIKAVTRPLYGLTREAVKAVQKDAGIKQDGIYGPATKRATIAVQARHGLVQDGFPGPVTIAALIGGSIPGKVPAPPAAPAFPLPRDPGALYYYGPASGPIESVSGATRNSKVPHDVTKDAHGRYRSKGLYAWQRQMKRRGWGIDVHGKFDDKTESVVRKFQKNKGLGVDGKIGPGTWAAAWTEPIR